LAIGFVAVATDDSVWFTDPYRNQITRRSATGTVTKLIIPTPNSYPSNIVAGRYGDVWFTEQDANKFGHATAQGKITEYKMPMSNAKPGAIALDANGNLWIACGAVNKIIKVSMPR
jgi:virginiamycin B lyase